jgi:hypothetical protein
MMTLLESHGLLYPGKCIAHRYLSLFHQSDSFFHQALLPAKSVRSISKWLGRRYNNQKQVYKD